MKHTWKRHNVRRGEFSSLLTMVVVLLALTGAGCRRTPEATLRALDGAEAVIESQPDSALTLLESIDTLTLRTAADRARHSLLLTMALDKTGVPLTDPTMLRPALDHYLRHGNPDQRMRTRYYEGCINLDTGNDVRAMECFLDAIADTTAVYTDSLGLALVYIGQGLTYGRQYRMHKYIELNEKALEIYKAKGDSVRASKTLGRILAGYTHLDDSVGRKRTLTELKGYLHLFPTVSDAVLEPLLSATADYGTPAEAEMLLDSVLESGEDRPDIMLTLAYGYDRIGQSRKAEALLDSVERMGAEYDTTRSIGIRSSALEKERRLKESYELYKTYYARTEDERNKLLNNDLLFTRQRFDLNEEHAMTLRAKDRTILVISFVVLICAIAILVTLLLLRIRTLKATRLELALSKLDRSLSDERSAMTELRLSLDKLTTENTEMQHRGAEL